MPVSIRKVGNRYQVRTPRQVHAYGTTKPKAQAQARLLRGIDRGWKPTGKKSRGRY